MPVTRTRILPAALLSACLLTLAACDGGQPEAASGPAAASPATAAAGASGSADKALCRVVNKAGSDMKAGISDAQQADGSVKPADAKKTFAKFHTTVSEALSSAPAGDVATAARAVADEISKAAAAADPIGTAADSDFAKLSEDLTTACKTAGVTINF